MSSQNPSVKGVNKQFGGVRNATKALTCADISGYLKDRLDDLWSSHESSEYNVVHPVEKNLLIYKYSNYLETEIYDDIDILHHILSIYDTVIINIKVESDREVTEEKREEIARLYNLSDKSCIFPVKSTIVTPVVFDHNILIEKRPTDKEKYTFSVLHGLNESDRHVLDIHRLTDYIKSIMARLRNFHSNPYELFKYLNMTEFLVYGRRSAITLREDLNLVGTVNIIYIEDKKFEYTRDPDLDDIIRVSKSRRSYTESTMFKIPRYLPHGDVKSSIHNIDRYPRKLKDKGVDETSVKTRRVPPSTFNPYVEGMFKSADRKEFGTTETTLLRDSQTVVSPRVGNPFASSKIYE